MGESQGAEDGLGGEGGEDSDQDEAGQQDQGGCQHGRFEQRLVELGIVRVSTRRCEKGESKSNETLSQISILTHVKEAGDPGTR